MNKQSLQQPVDGCGEAGSRTLQVRICCSISCVVCSLLSCEEVAVVKGDRLLSGEVRSVTTALKVVEEVQEEVQEIRDKWEGEEEEGNGGLRVEEIRSSCDDYEMTRTSETWATMWCAIMTTRTWLLDYAHMGTRLHSRDVHVRCVESALGLGGHVVIGVVLGFTTQTLYQV